MNSRIFAGVAAVLFGLQSATARAEDAFYLIPFKDLTLVNGAWPTNAAYVRDRGYVSAEPQKPYVVLDGDGEAYAQGVDPAQSWSRGVRPVEEGMKLAVRATKDKEVTGKLFVPLDEGGGMVAIPFKLSPVSAKAGAKSEFYQAKQAYYDHWMDVDIPGSAWFRHQRDAAEAASAQTNANQPVSPRRTRINQSEATYELFSGGRAVSENLQLDRAMRAAKPGEGTVEVTTLEGITVKAMDWKPLIKDAKPEIDPLAVCIPADQHAIFFRSFGAMTQLTDEADTNGTALLRLFATRSEDMNTRGRYQKQLCLGLTELARQFGPQMIDSVAFTGSDPDLRTGGDVGVLFEAKSPEAVKTYLLARQAAAASVDPDIKSVQGEVEGVAWTGVEAPDRSVCAYLAVRSNVVFVSNSKYELGQLLKAATGKTPAIVSQDEYTFFRSRYPRGDQDETGFVILTDATIRRWCSPVWRIASSRRTRAAAVMTELQAAHLGELVKGDVQVGPLKTDLSTADMGEVRLTKRGVECAGYGNLNFLTPIGELALAKVTTEEAASYQRWRDTYQQNWSQYFDPIAARFAVSSNRLGLELTVMPLIVGTEYREFIGFTTGAALGAGSGDPHAGTLAHLAVAVNSESEPIKQGASFLGTMAPGLRANALGWLGQCVAVYAEEDPFWNELAKAKEADAFFETNFPRLPVALYCEVKNPLGVAAFLTALRGFADQTAPGMATWTDEKYRDLTYVKVTAKTGDTEPGAVSQVAIYYAVTPRSLTVTLNEDVMKRALDRQMAMATGTIVVQPPGGPWLGSNLCLQVDRRFATTLLAMNRESGEDNLQTLSWNNLPILNEWKRLFPAQDPVKFHEQFWQTKLVCPGGGTYVWNDQWQTMESTVYGCPAAPKKGPDAFAGFLSVSNINFGLSFESNGLSARAVLNR